MHLHYIQRDGVERGGVKAELYGRDGALLASTFEDVRPGERHQFRLIVAPEDAAELELTGYVRRLMAQVERDVGRRVEWGAVNHYNTAHPHAHVVVRGVGLDGDELRLDRQYIAHGMRFRAQELATQELGLRTEIELRQTRQREVTQERFTSLDRVLERQSKELCVEIPTTLARSRGVDPWMLRARLEHLETMRLAERAGPHSWTLAPGWGETLRELAVRGDILKEMHRTLRGDPARYQIVRPGQELPEVLGEGKGAARVGRVADKGLSDELYGALYAVIETPNGFAYHVRLDARAADELRIGDLVSFATKPETGVRSIDRQIANAAAQGRGRFVLSPRAPPEEKERATRRLQHLERLGLVRPLSPGQWTVPADLIARLEQRHRTEPQRHRLFIDKQPLSLEAQARYPGPVWLDRAADSGLAPFGFGGEVLRALEQRRETLRELGIAPGDPQRDAKLGELERRTVGERIAARTHQRFFERVPSGFRGEVQLSPDAGRLAVVSDGVRFVLTPATREVRALSGKTVSISRDGRLTLERGLDRDRGLER